jgi:hypothetical protein
MELYKYWEEGYSFVEGSYYGDSDVEDWEDVKDILEEVEEEEYLELVVSVDDEKKVVYLFVQDYE